MPLRTGEYTVRVLIAVLILALAFVLWRVREAVVIVFGGVVLAVLVRMIMRPVVRHTPVREGWALLIAVLLLIGIIALTGLLIGTRISSQMEELQRTLQSSLSQVATALDRSPLGHGAAQLLRGQATSAMSLAHVAALATGTVTALVDGVLMIFLGLYLAANPALYERGLCRLVPPGGRPATGRALAATGVALTRWLQGVMLSMVIIAVTTGLGLWGLGVPLALSLAILAGLLEFIPYLGPIIAAVPAVLVAFAVSPTRALEVIALYVLIHQLEGDLVVPLIQRWAVALPPAMAIVAVLVFGLLFGPLGFVFATPMMVAAIALIDTLYVKSPPLQDRSART